MMRSPLLAGGLLVLLCADTYAYQRSRDPTNQACLWWENRSIAVMVNQACSADVSFASCKAAIAAGLAAWTGVGCSDFAFTDGGTTIKTEAGYNTSGENENLVVWREASWEHDQRAIALTTTTYNRASGEIVDSDLEMNGVNFTFTTVSPGAIVDIANTVAHEAGHMLGLDHTTDSAATMYAYAPQGEVKKRTLESDDIAGVCHVYPAGGPLPDCPGFVPDSSDSGCATLPGGGALFPLLALLVLARRSIRWRGWAIRWCAWY